MIMASSGNSGLALTCAWGVGVVPVWKGTAKARRDKLNYTFKY